MPAHRVVQDRMLVSVARLDRILCNVYTAEILDLKPSTMTLGNVADRTTLSDHIPVCLAFAPKPRGPPGVYIVP
eukprot:3624808-Pyramimonas_sp.AAC.1